MLETSSQWADIISCFFAFIGLISIGAIYKSVNNQSTNNHLTINGDAVIRESLNVSSTSKEKKK
jgi:hypothetical protein